MSGLLQQCLETQEVPIQPSDKQDYRSIGQPPCCRKPRSYQSRGPWEGLACNNKCNREKHGTGDKELQFPCRGSWWAIQRTICQRATSVPKLRHNRYLTPFTRCEKLKRDTPISTKRSSPFQGEAPEWYINPSYLKLKVKVVSGLLGDQNPKGIGTLVFGGGVSFPLKAMLLALVICVVYFFAEL